MAATEYPKHYIPLESNPEVFTQLIHNLGVSKSLAFVDVLSLEDPDLLAFVPRPVLALILVFPTSPIYEKQKKEDEDSFAEYTGRGQRERVMWFKQTINNACGLYGILHAGILHAGILHAGILHAGILHAGILHAGILHAVINGDARAAICPVLMPGVDSVHQLGLTMIVPDSLLAKLLNECLPLNPVDRALALEQNQDLESAHRAAALQGDSEVPASAEDEVDFHYVCFVKSNQNGHLYEMDGDRKGPIDQGPLGSDEDLFAESALDVIRQFIQRENDGDVNFSLLALVYDN